MATPYKDLFDTVRCLMVDEAQPLLKDAKGNPLLVQFDNAPFDKPTDLGWVRFANAPESDRQVDIGAKLRRFRIEGVVIVSVYTPLNEGDSEGIILADIIANVFRGRSFQGVTFRTPVVRPLGRVGKEWVVEIRCPFQTDNLL